MPWNEAAHRRKLDAQARAARVTKWSIVPQRELDGSISGYRIDTDPGAMHSRFAANLFETEGQARSLASRIWPEATEVY